MRQERAFVIAMAAAAAMLPACKHDAIDTANHDASAGIPEINDATPVPPEPPADATADVAVGNLADTRAPGDLGASPADADARITDILEGGTPRNDTGPAADGDARITDILEGGTPRNDTGPAADADASPGSLPEAGGSEVRDTSGSASASLVVDRSVVNLGVLDLTAPGVGTVTVFNVGQTASGPITVTVSTGVTATGCSGGLVPGGSCTITILVTPTVAGAFSGVVAIFANPGTVIPLQVSVIATVSGALLFDVSPAAIDLGDVLVGTVAPKQSLTITTRVGLSDLAVSTSGLEVVIDKPASTCTTVLAANTSCTVVVGFVAVTAGVKSDSVVISAGGAHGKTVSVPITAVAQAPAKLVINPSTEQWFLTGVGQTSTPVNFGVANTGDVPTGLISVAITGPIAADFTATSTCLVLAPLAACTVAVTYTPSAATVTPATVYLVVADTGEAGSSVTVPLSSAHATPASY